MYICTSSRNLRHLPGAHCSAEEFGRLVDLEVDHYRRIWNAVEQNVSAQIVQNNFELPSLAPLGNLEASSYVGASRFVLAVNAQFADAAAANQRLLLQDNHRLSAGLGLGRWHDSARYFAYKIPLTPEANAAVARSVASIVRALYGRSRKVLVLDLDNTLWGGVIGDDGVGEDPDRQRNSGGRGLHRVPGILPRRCATRGVLLAVCSKNDDDIARQRLQTSRLRPASSNTSPPSRPTGIPSTRTSRPSRASSTSAVDSFVFVDDNPAERAIVAAQVPGVAVPDVGSDVAALPAASSRRARYFEPVTLSPEDLARAALYRANAQRATLRSEVRRLWRVSRFARDDRRDRAASSPSYMRAHRAAHQQDQPVQPHHAPLHRSPRSKRMRDDPDCHRALRPARPTGSATTAWSRWLLGSREVDATCTSICG